MTTKRHKYASGGFTLIELLITVAIIAGIATLAVVMLGGTERQAYEAMAQNDLNTIRKAFWQFKNDMGQPPRYLAELMQSPDSNDARGGWWWREADDRPASHLFEFDPAINRGWNGPYLKIEFVSEVSAEAREYRTNNEGNQESITSDSGAGNFIAILLAPGQSTETALVESAYELDFGDPEEIIIRYHGAILDPPQPEQALGTGIRTPEE